MMIIPQLVKREARPHFSATYCSLLLRIHLRRYHMTLCWFAPKHQKDFSYLFHILFFLSSPQLGSHEFPSADYFLLLSLILTVLHSPFAHTKHLPSHTLPGAFPGPILSHRAAFVTATLWVLEIMLTFSSMLCAMSCSNSFIPLTKGKESYHPAHQFLLNTDTWTSWNRHFLIPTQSKLPLLHFQLLLICPSLESLYWRM